MMVRPHVIALLERAKLHLHSSAVVVVDLATLCDLIALSLRQYLPLVVAAIDALHVLACRQVKWLGKGLMRVY